MEEKTLDKNIETTDVNIMHRKNNKNETKLVGVISLGCDKNRVDTEVMLTYLRDAGYKFTADATKADIIIINTCGFISNARSESLDAVAEMIEYRKDPNSRCERIIVTGCLTQKWSNEMREDYPEVDIILGVDQYPDIAKIIKASYDKNKKIVKVGSSETIPYVKNRMVTTPAHYAYLKIAEGCDNYCTFCTIPFIRGRYRSRDIDSIVNEAKELVDSGATELILVAQDVSRFGTDKSGKSELVKLIKKLSKIENLRWIRLLYCYPEMISDELLNEMVTNPKLCKYLDIPLQHISDSVLKRMNRHTTKADILKLVDRLKNLPTFVAIRTTFMAGFPGETEQEFNELCEFVKEAKLMHVGFFAYSREDNTVAAKLPDQVDEDVKTKRVLKLMKIQKKVAAENNKKFIGKVIDVCYEGIDYRKQLFFGRSEYQTPEADTLVFFKSKTALEIGKYYKVKITKVIGYDLKGEIVNE